QSRIVDLSRQFPSHIAEVPGLVPVAREIVLGAWIAQDETEPPRVRGYPPAGRRAAPVLVHVVGALRLEVERRSELMFGVAGPGRLQHRRVVAELCLALVEEPFLRLIAPVRGDQADRVPGRF